MMSSQTHFPAQWFRWPSDGNATKTESQVSSSFLIFSFWVISPFSIFLSLFMQVVFGSKNERKTEKMERDDR